MTSAKAMDIRLFTTIVVLCTKLACSSHNEPTQPPGPRANTTHVTVVAYKGGGVIRSDGFPYCCGQGQTGRFSYLLKCRMPLHDCRIKLEFSDLDLPCGSWLQLRHAESDKVPFYMSDHGVLCDQTHARPVVLSESHTLHITIYIPTLPLSQVYFDHVGYKATYKGIIKERITQWTPPRTSGCEGISVDRKTVVPLVGYIDCVWLIHVPVFKDVWIGNVTDHAVVVVHGGLSSEGDILYDSTRDASHYIPLSQYRGVGLYIRARLLINAKHQHFTLDFPTAAFNVNEVHPEKQPANSSLSQRIQRMEKDSDALKSYLQNILNPKIPDTLFIPGGAQSNGSNTNVSPAPSPDLPAYLALQFVLIALFGLPILIFGAYKVNRRCKKGNRMAQNGHNSSSTSSSGGSCEGHISPVHQEDANRVQSVGSVGPCGTSGRAGCGRRVEGATHTHPPDYDQAVADSPPSYSDVVINI